MDPGRELRNALEDAQHRNQVLEQDKLALEERLAALEKRLEGMVVQPPLLSVEAPPPAPVVETRVPRETSAAWRATVGVIFGAFAGSVVSQMFGLPKVVGGTLFGLLAALLFAWPTALFAVLDPLRSLLLRTAVAPASLEGQSRPVPPRAPKAPPVDTEPPRAL